MCYRLLVQDRLVSPEEGLLYTPVFVYTFIVFGFNMKTFLVGALCLVSSFSDLFS